MTSTSISTILLSILSFALLSCQIATAAAANQNSFDNFVMSYGDFERCTFGLCRYVKAWELGRLRGFSSWYLVSFVSSDYYLFEGWEKNLKRRGRCLSRLISKYSGCCMEWTSTNETNITCHSHIPLPTSHRHETPAAPAKKPPHSIRAFKKARGGHSHSKPKNVNAPSPMVAQARHNHSPKDVNPCSSSSASGGVTASSLECGSVDHPYGWGMF